MDVSGDPTVDLIWIEKPDASGILDDVARYVPALEDMLKAGVVVSSAALPFYDDYALIELAFTNPKRCLYGLHAPGDFWLLDGRSTPIYRVNTVAPLRLSRATVSSYASFFLTFVSPPLHGVSAGRPGTQHATQPVDRARLLSSLSPEKVRTRDDGYTIDAPDGIARHLDASGRVSIAGVEVDPPPLRTLGRFRRIQAIPGIARWTRVTPDERTRLLGWLQPWAIPGHGDNSAFQMRRADVSFYRTHAIYELLLAADGEQRQSYMIAGGGEVRALDATSRPIHETNAVEPPVLQSPHDASEYLRFFCWAISGDKGRFILVERLRDIAWATAPPEPERAVLRDRLEPIHVEARAESASADDRWRLSATIAYDNAVFRGHFEIDRAGTVGMIDDEPIITGLPVRTGADAESHIATLVRDDARPATYLDAFCVSGASAELRTSSADAFVALLRNPED